MERRERKKERYNKTKIFYLKKINSHKWEFMGGCKEGIFCMLG
jgi:hypothetical protein